MCRCLLYKHKLTELVLSTSPSNKWWRRLITTTTAKASSSFRAIGNQTLYSRMGCQDNCIYISVFFQRLPPQAQCANELPFPSEGILTTGVKIQDICCIPQVDHCSHDDSQCTSDCLTPPHWPRSNIHHVPPSSLIPYIIVDMHFMVFKKLNAFTFTGGIAWC